MRNLHWQLHLSFTLGYRQVMDEDFRFYDHYLTLGPLQLRWRGGRIWPLVCYGRSATGYEFQVWWVVLTWCSLYGGHWQHWWQPSRFSITYHPGG